MKKKLLALLISIMFLMPTAVYANGSTNSSSNGSTKSSSAKGDIQSKKDEAQAKIQEKKTEMEAFKAQVKERNALMKKNHGDLKQLRSEIQTKRQALNSLLTQVKEGTIVLSYEDLASLKTQVDLLKEDAEKVKEYTNLNENKDAIQNEYDCEDFESAYAGLNNLIEKQEERQSYLESLNSTLDSILSIF